MIVAGESVMLLVEVGFQRAGNFEISMELRPRDVGSRSRPACLRASGLKAVNNKHEACFATPGTCTRMYSLAPNLA
jgi:hypothetical protein